MIRLRGVVRSFGPRRVLSGIDLEVGRGELAVITGPAGSGKSTLLRTIATLAPADSGTIEIDGLSVPSQLRAARARVAFADGWLAPGDELTAAEYLDFALAKPRSQDPAAVLQRAGIEAKTPLHRLSARERSRLAIACALAAKKDVVLLDAPVDPCFAEWINEVRGDGAAIVVTAAAADTSLAPGRVLRLEAGKLER